MGLKRFFLGEKRKKNEKKMSQVEKEGDEELEEIRRKKLEELKRKMMKPKEMIKMIIEVNDSDFQEKIIEKSKEIPVVVDFWAAWCMPCQILGPILEKLVREHEGKFILAKVNVDFARETAIKYGISTIPSVKMFKNGKVVDEFIGALPEPAVREWLERIWSKK
jgi:putative thioredoxin